MAITLTTLYDALHFAVVHWQWMEGVGVEGSLLMEELVIFIASRICHLKYLNYNNHCTNLVNKTGEKNIDFKADSLRKKWASFCIKWSLGIFLFKSFLIAYFVKKPLLFMPCPQTSFSWVHGSRVICSKSTKWKWFILHTYA